MRNDVVHFLVSDLLLSRPDYQRVAKFSENVHMPALQLARGRPHTSAHVYI